MLDVARRAGLPFVLGCIFTWLLLSLETSFTGGLGGALQLRAVRAGDARGADAALLLSAADRPVTSDSSGGSLTKRPVDGAAAAQPEPSASATPPPPPATSAAQREPSASASPPPPPPPPATSAAQPEPSASATPPPTPQSPPPSSSSDGGAPSNTPTTTPSGTFSNKGSATHTQTTETEAQMRARMAAEYAREHGGGGGSPVAAALARMTPAERALHARLEQPLQPHCSDAWAARVAAYGRFHNESVARLLAGRGGGGGGSPGPGEQPHPRIVVYTCREGTGAETVHTPDCGGYADRLAGMSHVFLLALVHDWLFFADWRGQPDVFNSPWFDYAWRPELAAGMATQYHDFLSCPYQGAYKDCPLGLPDPPATFPAGTVHQIATNKGGLRWGSKARVDALLEPGWGLDKWTQGGCVFRALLKPTPALVARLTPVALELLSPLYRVVGVHKRTGDRQMAALDEAVAFSPRDRYWQCAMRKENELRNYTRGEMPTRFFLVADSAKYKRDALAHFGLDKLLVTDVEPIHVAQMQLIWDGIVHRDGAALPPSSERLARAFTDWWLLSLCPTIVAPGFSGFSRTAFAMSMARIAFLMENFEGKYMTGCRDVDGIPQWRMVDLGAGF